MWSHGHVAAAQLDRRAARDRELRHRDGWPGQHGRRHPLPLGHLGYLSRDDQRAGSGRSPGHAARARGEQPSLDGHRRVTRPGYSGPCSTAPMAYAFTVFALKVAVLPGVTPASTAADVFAAIRANAIASAQLTGLANHYRS
jgi:hypothetical protein